MLTAGVGRPVEDRSARPDGGARLVPQFDLPLAELRAYAPDLAEPADLDAFWATTLAETRRHDLAATFTPVDTACRRSTRSTSRFAGYGGRRSAAGCTCPAGATRAAAGRRRVHRLRRRARPAARARCSGRGRLRPPGHGHPRPGQRAGGRRHAGPGPDGGAGAPRVHDPRASSIPATYYYRRVFTDAVRAVEAARSHPAVDAGRVAVTGGSQGGGITLAVAGLVPDLAGGRCRTCRSCATSAVRSTLIDADPYGEIARYLKIHRDHVEPRLRDAVLLRRRQLRGRGQGARRCSRSG